MPALVERGDLGASFGSGDRRERPGRPIPRWSLTIAGPGVAARAARAHGMAQA
jgi:hypothetical protein